MTPYLLCGLPFLMKLKLDVRINDELFASRAIMRLKGLPDVLPGHLNLKGKRALVVKEVGHAPGIAVLQPVGREVSRRGDCPLFHFSGAVRAKHGIHLPGRFASSIAQAQEAGKAYMSQMT